MSHISPVPENRDRNIHAYASIHKATAGKIRNRLANNNKKDAEIISSLLTQALALTAARATDISRPGARRRRRRTMGNG